MFDKRKLTEILNLQSGRAVQIFSKTESNSGIIKDIYDNTTFLPDTAGLIQRVVCLYKDITGYGIVVRLS